MPESVSMAVLPASPMLTVSGDSSSVSMSVEARASNPPPTCRPELADKPTLAPTCRPEWADKPTLARHCSDRIIDFTCQFDPRVQRDPQ